MTDDVTDPLVEVDLDELTDEQVLTRLTRARNLIDRARAARAYIDGRDNPPDLIMAGFLALFHPDLDETRTRALIADARRPTP